jgi:hypothetical protein
MLNFLLLEHGALHSALGLLMAMQGPASTTAAPAEKLDEAWFKATWI